MRTMIGVKFEIKKLTHLERKLAFRKKSFKDSVSILSNYAVNRSYLF